MRREGFAGQLEHFEVLADRELMPGYASVAQLRPQASPGGASSQNGAAQAADVAFAKMMVKAASHLLAARVGAVYAFAEREQIAVVLAGGPQEGRGRDAKDALLRLVAEASAKMSLLAGVVVPFEGRLYEFPSRELAVQYFRWRQDQSRASALDRLCVFLLTKEGGALPEARTRVDGMPEADKVELLRKGEIAFDALPAWQRRGIGVYLRDGDAEPAAAGAGPAGPRLIVDPHLPTADAYSDYVKRFLARG
jgi:tRNA(His) 5'-end guanylyltransferase